MNALDGCQVLDLADDMGALGSRYLADMGAEVIRIEKPDFTPNRSPFYLAANRGKRLITLDIEAKSGRDVFKRLLETSDVLVESLPPGYLSKLGFGYADIKKINPRLIMASITPFGQTGPYCDYRSSDIVAQAVGGQMYVSGEPSSPPLKAAGNQSYHLAATFTAIGIMLALFNRHTSGKGQHIDISLQECVSASLDHILPRYFYTGEIAKRQACTLPTPRLASCRVLVANQLWAACPLYLAPASCIEVGTEWPLA